MKKHEILAVYAMCIGCIIGVSMFYPITVDIEEVIGNGLCLSIIDAVLLSLTSNKILGDSMWKHRRLVEEIICTTTVIVTIASAIFKVLQYV